MMNKTNQENDLSQETTAPTARIASIDLIRGAWLIFLELTFLRVAWTFNFDFAHYEMAGVIWAIGWCMVLLAGLVKLPLAALGAIGLVIIAGHNLMDPYLDELIPALGGSSFGGFWKILYLGFFEGPIRFGADGPNLIVLYSIVPFGLVWHLEYTPNADHQDNAQISATIGIGRWSEYLKTK